MTSRIIHRNRIIWQNIEGWEELARARRRKCRRTSPLCKDREGNPVDCASGIPTTSARSPYRAGVPVTDPDEGITYRLIWHIDPLQGWAPTEFWQKRWGFDHRSIVILVEYGYLDAAIEEGSAVKRYRCRDENRLLTSTIFKQRKQAIKVRKYQDKRPRLKLNAKGWDKGRRAPQWHRH